MLVRLIDKVTPSHWEPCLFCVEEKVKHGNHSRLDLFGKAFFISQQRGGKLKKRYSITSD